MDNTRLTGRSGDRDKRSESDCAESSAVTRRRDSQLFVLLWIPYALLVCRFWFVCDDAYITFRYARNWAQGHGLRYNLGEHVPVEGYSNFLWVAICAAFEFAKVQVTFWAPALSFVCGTILLYYVFVVLRRRLELDRWIAAIAVLFLGCSPAYASWSSSGLETMLFALLLFTTFERLFLRREGPAPVVAGVAGLALALTRVEGIYWVAFLLPLAIVTWRSQSRKVLRPALMFVAIVGAGYAIYFACRYSYYQLPFSNSVYAKVAMSTAVLQRGLDYLAVQCLTLLTPVLVLPGLVVALRRSRRAIGIPIALPALAVVGFTVVVSGDFMAFGRLMVPGLAFNAVLFAWLLQDCRGCSVWRWWLTAAFGVAVVCVGVLPAVDIHPVPQSMRESFHFRLNAGKLFRSELAQWRFEKENAQGWADIGRTLRDYASPGDSLVAGAIGAVGYYSNLFIYDGFGLVTRKVTARSMDGPSRMSPGHDKAVGPEFFLDDRPTFLEVGVATGESLADIAQQIAHRAYGFRQRGPDSLYVGDFAPILRDQPSGRLSYMIIWKRIEDGVDPEAAWSDLSDRVRALSRGGP